MKVSIIGGAGRVGSAIAFALVSRGLGGHLALVDRDAGAARGDALDLLHASAMGRRPASVAAGGIEASAASDVLILTAAAPAVAGAPRAAQAAPNAALLRQLVPALAAASPDAILVVVTNPVDAMTRLALDLSGFPPGRVLGTGTLLDTARFRVLLSERLGVHPRDIRAYILGEHGESQFPVLSSAHVGGARIDRYLSPAELRATFDEARSAGHAIVRHKGHTAYGVALATAMVVEAIVTDSRETMPVSTLADDYHGVGGGVCLSVPAVVGRRGVERTLLVDLDDVERQALHRSAEAVRATLREAGVTT